jgi:hypothetical protein
MSAKGRRLERLLEGLTARERVVLIQTAVYEGSEPEQQIWDTAPSEQSSEIRRLGELACQAHLVLTTHIAALHFVVEALELRWLLLTTQLGWAFDRSSLLLDASFVAHVPITNTEYEAKRAEIAADVLTVNDAAEFMLLLEEDDSKAAIRRAEKQVRAAIKNGELKAERQGRGYQMSYAAYCDWRGETVEPFPDWGRAYDVVPDDAVYFVESAERLRLATESGPHNPTVVLPALAREPEWLLPEEKQSVHDRLLVGLARHIAQGVPQQEMEVAVLTEVVEAVAAEFKDEAVVAELNRAMLNDARARLAALRKNASPQVGEIDDAPDHEAMAEQIRRQIFDSEA